MRYAGESMRESVVVFNGDVLTEIDLAAVIRLHRERKAKATIVLTPVDNPSAYGLVETDAAGNIQRFLEKPNPDEITCNTINAGIYVLEPDTFDRIPKDTPWSIERSFFPSLIERGETFMRLRRSRATGSTSARPRNTCRCTATSWTAAAGRRRSPARRVVGLDLARGARRGRRRHRGALLHRRGRRRQGRRPHRALQRHRPPVLDRRARHRSTARSSGPTPASARKRSSGDRSSGRQCHVGRSALVENGVVLGDKSVITDYSRL